MLKRTFIRLAIFCLLIIIAVSVLHFTTSPKSDPDLGELDINAMNMAKPVVIPPKLITYKTSQVIAPKGTIKAFIADDKQTMELGLSWRNKLATSSSMLFIFQDPDKYGFWMKDMRFPISIVWIDPARKVIGISRNLATSTYPKSFFPPKDIGYALELNPQSVNDFGIATGTVLKFVP